MLHFRGRGTVFGSMLLVQVIPFQLLMIPLYVLIARTYGLADNYLGMILPFAINSTAVFIFRQFFLQLPKELFDAARIDGASELRILWSIALPLVRPALLTAVLLTFIGPWNEFLWPFLITKQQSMQPLAVSLANYISTVAASAANPFGAILAGACVLAVPAVALFIAFQTPLRLHGSRIRREGMTMSVDMSSARSPRHVPYTLTRLGVVMAPDPGDPNEAEGVLNPASGRDRTAAVPAAAAGRGRQRLPGRPGRDRDRTGRRPGRRRTRRRRARTGRRLGTRRRPRRRRGPAGHLGAEPRRARDDLRRLRAARPEAGAGRLRPICAPGSGWDPCTSSTRHDLDIDLNLFPNKDVVFFPEPVPGPDGDPCYAALHRPMWDLDWIVAGRGNAAAGGHHRRPARASGSPTCRSPMCDRGHLRAHPSRAATGWSRCREYDFEALKIGAGPPPIRVPEGWLLIHHGVTGELIPGVDQQQKVHYAAGRDDAVRRRPVARCSPAPITRCWRRRPRTNARHRPQRGVPDGHREDRRPHVRLLRHGRLHRSASPN